MLIPPPDQSFIQIQAAFLESNGVTTDSRKLEPGKLFFALRGEHFDGNKFALDALKQGCQAAIIDDIQLADMDARLIWVPDSLAALQALARWHRRKWTCPVIGLTGSNGKTTTKELLKTVFGKSYPLTFATAGNFNNEIGVPLTLLSMPQNPQMVIIEMGANAQGEIALLAEIAEPTHAVITNIGRAHLEGFGGEEGVKAGKSELFKYLRHAAPALPDSCVFVHAGHENLLEVSEGMERRLYGTPGFPPFIIEQSSESTFQWQDREGNILGPTSTALTGSHNMENMMTAVAIGLHFNISSERCNEALLEYEPTNNRSQWTQTQENRVLLDAYNANPSSVIRALDSFAKPETAYSSFPSICILGDMAELGAYGPAAHLEVLEHAIGLGLTVWTVGPLFSAASNGREIHSFPHTDEVQAFLSKSPLRQCRILLKGSRSMALESLIDVL